MKQTSWRSLIWSICLCLILQRGSRAMSSLDLSPEVIQLKDSVSQSFHLSEKEHQSYCPNRPTFKHPISIKEKAKCLMSSRLNKNRATHVNIINRNISIIGNNFVLDGKTIQIMSGSLHYFRLPSEYWRDRLRKLRAAGLNTVSTYVEWSSHQPEEDLYLFDDDNDIKRFIQIAAEENLYVLLRPGPYICAERDLGGLPYWLLSKYPKIKLRSSDKDFIVETNKWMAKLFLQLSSLLYGNGGPIIMVQVENEYGSYSNSKRYMEAIRDIIKEHVGDKALLYTTDGQYHSYFYDGSVPGALTTIDFGPTDGRVIDSFKQLRAFMPVGPLMNSEYYPGWLTHWSEEIQQVSTGRVVFTLQDMVNNNINFNFYMFFGGTNFEFSAGANYGSSYQPDITSYDYDAPLTEAGDPTPKYNAIRNTLAKFNLVPHHQSAPVVSKKGSYGEIQLVPKINLLSPEGRSKFGIKHEEIHGINLPTFEQLRQRSGLVLYETTLNETDGVLTITEPRDWILVYVDNKFQGVISRMLKQYELKIKTKRNSVLSLLVENQGRINYGDRLHDFKGILSPIKINDKNSSVNLDGPWSITGYPLEVKNNLDLQIPSDTLTQVKTSAGPLLFEGTLILPEGEQPLDTFIDTTGLGKGYIFVNGHNLGRYWPKVGPQVTLYLPGVWLQAAPAKNIIKVIELEQTPQSPSLAFIDYPILNRTGSLIDYLNFGL